MFVPVNMMARLWQVSAFINQPPSISYIRLSAFDHLTANLKLVNSFLSIRTVFKVKEGELWGEKLRVIDVQLR